MAHKLPTHLMNAQTLRALAAYLDEQARAMRFLADDLDREAERSKRRGAALKAYQESRRKARDVQRDEIIRRALEQAPAALLASASGIPLRTVQRIKRDVAPR